MYIYVCVHTHTYMESERERERDLLSHVVLLKKSFQISVECFVWLLVSFALQKLYSFIRFINCRSQYLHYQHSLQKNLPCDKKSYAFCFIRVNISGFLLRTLIHLELKFVLGNQHGSICFFLQADIWCYKYHLLNLSFSPVYFFLFHLK